MGLLSYFAKNSSLRLIIYTINIAAAFTVTPHILNSMGSNIYSIWALIAGLIPYFSLVNLANASTVSTLISRTQGPCKQDIDQKIFVGAIQLSCFALLATIGISACYYVMAQPNLSKDITPMDFALSLGIFSVSFGTYLILNVGHGILAGNMRWTVLSLTTLLRVLVSSGAVLLFLDVNHSAATNLFRMTIISALSFLLEGSCNFVLAARHISFPPLKSFFTTPLYMDLVRLGREICTIMVGTLLCNSTQIYMVGAWLSAGQVTIFALVRQILSYMTDLLQNVFGILTPYFNKLHYEEGQDSTPSTLLKTLFFSYGSSSIITLGLIFYGNAFFTRWLGPEFSHIHTILTPMVLACFCSAGAMPVVSYIYSQKKQKLLVKLTLIEGVLITTISIPALFLYGLEGIAWTLFMTSFSIRVLVLPLKVCAFAEIPVQTYYTNMAWALIPCIMGQSLYYHGIKEYIQAQYIDIFLLGLGQSFVAGLTLLLVMLFIQHKAKNKA